MLVPRLQDHLGIVAPARCARPDGGRGTAGWRGGPGAAHSPAGRRAEGGPFPPRGPGGGESSKAGRRLLALAVRPGGGAGLARLPPLPPLRLSRRPRNAGGRGRGHPVSGHGPAPAAPPRRTRAPGRPARTRGLPARAGSRPGGGPGTPALFWASVGICRGQGGARLPGAAVPPSGSDWEEGRVCSGREPLAKFRSG